MTNNQGWHWGEQDTVIDALARAVARAPERPFLDFSGDIYTYNTVNELTNKLANSLISLGVKPGETVSSMLDNNIDAVITWLAINKIGAVSVPVNTALRGEFLRHQLADSDASIIICENDYLDRITAIAEDLPKAKLVLYRGNKLDTTSKNFSIEAFDQHRGNNVAEIDFQPKPSDLAALIYTSGTTGPSKGCMISANYITNLAKQKLRFNPATENDVAFTPLPIFHMNAISSGITSTLMVGGTVAIAPRFSVSKFWPEVERSGATIASILGSMGILLAQAPDNDAMKRCFGQLHTIRGNPFREDIKKIWRDRFGAKRVASMDYGLTEAAIVTGVDGSQPTAPGSSGKRIPDFDVRVVDEDDKELPPGKEGEIIIRPNRPNIMFSGYWKRPEATLQVMKNMWLHSGDIGKFDEDGFFYFCDRKKDYLRRRGENISSYEMEAAFSAHPDILEVAVHAVLSPAGEDDLKVTAILHQGSTLSEADLCRWCLDKVPYYAVPRFIEFRGNLPRNPQGKVLKYQLREEGATPTTWDIEVSDVKIVKR